MKKISKNLRVTLIICLSILLFFSLLLFGIRLYFRVPVLDYYNASEKAFKIPEIDSGFVPQGFCYDRQDKVFLTSGYSSKDKPSTVHVIDRESGNTLHSVELLDEDGAPHTGHAGGVGKFKDWVYVAGSSDHCIYVYSYEEITSGAKQVKSIGCYFLETYEDDYLKASFLTVVDNRLVVGEFFHEPSYKTLNSHKITSSSGEKFGGIALEYVLNQDYEYGIASTPLMAYALPDKVQGVHFTNENFYLSTSLGLKHSYVYEYSIQKLEKIANYEILGEKIELKAFTQTARLKTYKIPPMSEGIVIIGSKMYVMSEFACNKYFLGKFVGAKWCYSTDLTQL